MTFRKRKKSEAGSTVHFCFSRSQEEPEVYLLLSFQPASAASQHSENSWTWQVAKGKPPCRCKNRSQQQEPCLGTWTFVIAFEQLFSPPTHSGIYHHPCFWQVGCHWAVITASWKHKNSCCTGWKTYQMMSRRVLSPPFPPPPPLHFLSYVTFSLPHCL